MEDVTVHGIEMQEENHSLDWIDIYAEIQVPLVGDDEDVPEDLLDQLNHQESALATIVSVMTSNDWANRRQSKFKNSV